MAKVVKPKQLDKKRTGLAGKAKQIEEVYRDYLGKLADLQKQQNNLIAEFKKFLESKKLEEIKRSIG